MVYRDGAAASRDADRAAKKGWMPQGTSATGSQIDLRRTAANVILLGGLGLLAGSNQTKGTITITYIRTPPWLEEHNMVTKKPEIPIAVNSIDVVTQLERLAKLKDQGVLSEEEFQMQKKTILGT